jgi:hypothetical protein
VTGTGTRFEMGEMDYVFMLQAGGSTTYIDKEYSKTIQLS